LAPDATDNFLQDQTRVVRVTLTDKAGNTLQLGDISVTKGPPPTWPTFTANGGSTAFNNATFKGKYSSTIGLGDDLFMISGTDSVFTTRIEDTVAFTDAKLIVTGYRQSDGVLLNSGNTPVLADKTLNPSTGTAVGQNVAYTYSGLQDGEYSYRVQLFQNAAEINMQKYFIVDNTRPNIWVKKIEADDYLKDGDTKLGHIDMNEDFSATGYTTGIDTETNITGADMVSGVVKFHVKVKDNYRLKNVKVKMTDYYFGTGTRVDGEEFTLASRDATDNWIIPAQRGSITAGVASADYLKVTKVPANETLEKSVDYIYLTLEFNTAHLTNVAGLDKDIEFTAEDWVGNISDYTGGSYTKNTGTITSTQFYGSEPTVTKDTVLSVNNAKAVKFVLDVVPYITDVIGELESGTRRVIRRSATGAYPVKRGNPITIKGFNLSPVGVDNPAINIAGTVTGKDGTGSVNFTVGGAAVSGELRVTNNSFVSTNNVNNNNVESNQEPETYRPLINDDRYLFVWSNVGDTSLTGRTEAVMRPNAAGNGYDWMTASNNQSVFINNQRLSNSWTLRGGWFDRNSDGTLMYVFLHDMNWLSGSDNYEYHGSVQFGMYDVDNGQAFNWQNIDTNRLGLGNISFNGDPNWGTAPYNDKMMSRYDNMKIVVDGNNIETDVFVIYFDKSPNTRSLVYYTFKVGRGTDYGVTRMANVGGRWYSNLTKQSVRTGNYDNGVTGGTRVGLRTPQNRRELTVGGADSNHFDFVFHDDTLYVVYYDESAGEFNLIFNDAPITNQVSGWSVPILLDSGAGLYPDVKVDPDGGIHVAYYDTAHSNLKYVYLSDTTSTPSPIVVDALFTNGMNNSLAIKNFGTVDEPEYRPVISHFSLSYSGTKYSMRVSWPLISVDTNHAGAEISNGDYTGKWETVNILAGVPPKQEKTFTFVEGSMMGNIVVGYNGTNVERSTLHF